MYIESRNIRQNHATSMPQRLLFLDTETKGVKDGNIERHTMYMGWSYYVRRAADTGFKDGKWEFHDNAKALCKYIDSCVPTKTCLYLLAHNAFFDVQACGFFRHFSELGWELSFFYEAGLSYILTLRHGRRSIKVLSTTNWFQSSLAELGKLVDLPKLDIDLDTDDYESVKAYCKRDVEILVRAVDDYLHMLEDNDLGKFGLTRASQSFHAYRHRFMHEHIAVHTNEDIVALERLAYMGGRTEAFFLGTHHATDFVSLDFNSMYPYIMSTFDMPRELVDYKEDIIETDLDSLLSRYCAVAECHISTPEPVYARRMGHKIIFPIGEFTAYLTTPGIKYAYEEGHLIRVKRIALYNKANLFKEYIDYFYGLRQKYKAEGNDIYEQVCKYFMNSLYGKFGQKQPIETSTKVDAPGLYIKHEIFNTVTMEMVTETVLCNRLIVSSGFKEGKHSFVPIPAHITEYGRLMLWKIIKQAGPDNVLYCDTDSIKMEARYLDRVGEHLDNSELGKLKVEERFTEFTIDGCKAYNTENVWKLKGVPKRATKNPDGSYSYQTFLSQCSHLRLQESDAYIIRDTLKRLTGEYTKGIVNPNGSIVPIRLFDFE